MSHALLIADANPTILNLHRLFFLQHEYQVETAQNVQECARVLRAFQPDALILERDLPGEDGKSILDFLLEEKQLDGAPLILLSTTASPERFQWGRFSRVCFEFLKPCHLQDLLDCVRTLVRLKIRKQASEPVAHALHGQVEHRRLSGISAQVGPGLP